MKVKHLNRAEQTQTPWIQFPKPNPSARLRLFCFPYAGGAANVYRTWPGSLPASIEICAVQPPGRERRLHEEPFTSLLALVQAAAPALLPYMDRPFAFFGHSMGAWIGFELACYLRRENLQQPLHLFASGSPAPQIPSRTSDTYNLPEQEFLNELRRLNGTPREVLEHPELMELMLPLLRADFSVTGTYAFSDDDPLDMPITVFGGLQDEDISQSSLEAWRQQTNRAFALQMFPGDHFFLHTAQPQLLNVLCRELEQFTGKER
ncbi:MAG: putative thioesterase [Acidobacteria bacterium]|nr:putative thioesterase [Acidobacteriota bacterium]